MMAMIMMWDLRLRLATVDFEFDNSVYPIDTHTAVGYRGASVWRTMKAPATPPSPLHAVTAA